MEIKELEKWLSSEINLVISQIENTNRFPKARHEGYLSALKKVQAIIRK